MEINNNLGIAFDKLIKLDFNFLFIGGFICKAVLVGHARDTSDIDIVYGADFKRIEELFRKEFNVIRFDYYSYSDIATEESFTALININNEDILIEGRKFDCFNRIKQREYKIGNRSFLGVPIEFQIAEKIIALFSKQIPSYKHLIDLYSFSLLDESIINKKDIKKYLEMILNDKNKVKKELNLPLIKVSNHIDINKEFEGPIHLLTLQAKYNYSKEYIISQINEWFLSLDL